MCFSAKSSSFTKNMLLYLPIKQKVGSDQNFTVEKMNTVKT